MSENTLHTVDPWTSYMMKEIVEQSGVSLTYSDIFSFCLFWKIKLNKYDVIKGTSVLRVA